MTDISFLHEALECVIDKLWSIVTHDDVWNSMS